jgi:SAM-dependent methyltransferase
MTVKQFYDQLQFPGTYTLAQLQAYGDPIENRYLRAIDRELAPGQQVLDAGCGTGLTTNLFALRYPTSEFTGMDFADGVELANHFAHTNGITNVKYVKQDLAQAAFDCQYDRVICQGVLHHIPQYQQVARLLAQAVKPGGRLVLGLYHPWGKLLKQFARINYDSRILETDQESNPFELAFTPKQAQALVPELELISRWPCWLGSAVPALFNSRNGGLTVYIFERRLK